MVAAKAKRLAGSAVSRSLAGGSSGLELGWGQQMPRACSVPRWVGFNEYSLDIRPLWPRGAKNSLHWTNLV